MRKINQALIKAVTVLVPTYTVAYLTEKMIYVVPMLAASTFIAAALFHTDIERRVDEDAISKDEADIDVD
jgi:hypothetical protein